MPGLDLKLIVGLGNPGPEHADTRHNAGFWLVDSLAARWRGSLRAHSRYHGEVGRIDVDGRELWLLKPTTYMNRSGLAIRALMDYVRLQPAQILVAHDELDLPVGAVRLKQGGGAGGHNGLKDSIAHVGDAFWRLRLGIGHPGNRAEVIDYVLRRAPAAEEALIRGAVEAAADAIPRVLADGAEKVMNSLHRREPAPAN
ncbi:MAG: aminoacyl-tRNA hydrolase [Steroidobacteraceae bacterium]|jgi:PTH1 family peptidyl-tRNA hydrolase|nr:aminoacyl-tRNA hydrolase [Steroidobacteraceae bacterium]